MQSRHSSNADCGNTAQIAARTNLLQTTVRNLRRNTVGWFILSNLVLLFVALPSTAQRLAQDSLQTLGKEEDVLSVVTTLTIPTIPTYGKANVTISCPAGASRADRELEIVVYLKDSRFGGESKSLHKRVILAEGTTRVTVDIPVTDLGLPENRYTMIYWDVGVFEGGRDIEMKANQSRRSPTYNNLQLDSRNAFASLGQLVASAEELTGKVVDVSKAGAQPVVTESDLARVTNVLNEVFTLNMNPTNVTPQIAYDGKELKVSEAFTDWRDYIGYALWLASVDALNEIQQSAERASAFRNYLAAGGTLIVHGESFEDSQRCVEDWLGGPRRFDQGNFNTATLRYMGGKLILLKNDLETVRKDNLRSVVKAAAQQQTLSGQLNHNSDENWFWRNLVLSVGKPPIWRFCIAVTLFGAILGPGLLFFTGWIKRRSLMIFLVPAISLLVTLGIIAYGVLREGFETHSRITSVTHIDMPTGHGFSWSRQSFFSGMPPRSGINLSEDAFARPVREQSRGYIPVTEPDPREDVRYHVYYGEDQRWIRWLRARQQQQLLVGHSVDAVSFPLELFRRDGEVSIKNLTQQQIPIVAFRGNADDYYFAADLQPGEERVVEADDKASVNSDVAILMADLRPRAPEELKSGGSLFNFRFDRRTTTMEGNDILNVAFNRYLSSRGDIPKRGIAALVRRSDWIEVPVESKSADDLHMLIGEVQW